MSEERIRELETKLDAMRKRANRAEKALAQYEFALEKMNYPEVIELLREVQGR